MDAKAGNVMRCKQTWKAATRYAGKDLPLFIDCGPGHVGTEAWMCAENYPECCIVGFEPHEGRYDVLKPSYPGDLHCAAVSYLDGSVYGWNGLAEAGLPHSDFKVRLGANDDCHNYAPLPVPCLKLDTFFRGEDVANAFLWADVEGSELNVLRGAQDLLSTGAIKVVVVELIPDEYDLTREQVDSFLHGLDIHLREVVLNDYIYTL